MLPKPSRLRKKKDFENIFKNSLNFRGGFLILKVAEGRGPQKSRFAFIVSRKVSPKAVVRNKVRRRLSAVSRQEAKNIKNGMDIVLIALPGIEKKDYQETKSSLLTLFKKSDLYV